MTTVSQKKMEAVLSQSCPVSSYWRAVPMNLGICVLACRPVSLSSRLDGRTEDRHVVEPLGDRQILLLAGQAVELASTSFMPPCSVPSIFCICSSVSLALRAMTQSANFLHTSRACWLSQ